MVEIPMEGVLFLLSGIAIIHFGDMQKIHPFTYLPNKISGNKEEAMKKRKTPDLEKYLEGKKRRFVNYTQGAKIYKMSYWPFVRLAKRAEANYPIRKTAIVDLNILDDFLEDNPEVVSELKKRRGKRYGK